MNGDKISKAVSIILFIMGVRVMYTETLLYWSIDALIICSAMTARGGFREGSKGALDPLSTSSPM